MVAKKSTAQLLDNKGKSIENSQVKVKSALKSPKTDINPEFEKPIVSVSISNPFKKILYWLDQIRKKQTTTFAFKLSIPLIALPVIIFAAYQIGKGDGISLVNLYSSSPKPSVSASPTPKPQTEISKAGTLKIARGSTGTRYLLSLRNGAIVTLSIPQTIDLSRYANKQVLVTGYQDKSGLFTVNDIAEIEVYNATEIPQPSPSSKPTLSPSLIPTPEATSSAN